MAIESKYGKVPIKGIPEDEPLFVLRAQDTLAPAVIRFYAEQAEAIGSPEEFVDSARAVATTMLDWQVKNRDKVKAPD